MSLLCMGFYIFSCSMPETTLYTLLYSAIIPIYNSPNPGNSGWRINAEKSSGKACRIIRECHYVLFITTLYNYSVLLLLVFSIPILSSHPLIASPAEPFPPTRLQVSRFPTNFPIFTSPVWSSLNASYGESYGLDGCIAILPPANSPFQPSQTMPS